MTRASSLLVRVVGRGGADQVGLGLDEVRTLDGVEGLILLDLAPSSTNALMIVP